jgi:hypothetical protein
MFQPNNPAIDMNILNERARDELARARPASPEHAGEATNIGAPASLALAPSRISHFARNRLRRSPLLGNFLSWASWIVRVRQIARMVFKSDARLSEMQREIKHLDQALHGLEASFETNLKNFIASSWDNTRAIDALRAEIEVLHAQNASLREEIITRSRPADAN